MTEHTRPCRAWSRVAIALCCTALLAACTGGGGGSNTNSNSSPNSLKPVTLNVYLPKYVTTPSPGDDAVFAAANKIIKAKINATVNFHLIPSADYNTKMPTQLASGSSDIDLVQVANGLFGYTTPAEQGAFAPLDDLLHKYGKGILSAEPKFVVNAAQVQGKIYAVTQLQQLTLQPSWSVQRRVLQASGVKGHESNGVFVPSTSNPYAPDVVSPILAGAKANLTGTTKAFTLLGYPGGWGEQAAFDPMAYGLWPINAEVHSQFPFYVKMGTTEVTMGAQELKQYATMMRSFYTDGYMKSDAGTNAQPPPQSSANLGATFNWTGGGALSGFGTAPAGTPANQANVELPLSPVPFYMGFNYGWAIPASSNEPDRTMMLLNLLFTNRKLVMLLSYGFEGKDYSIKDHTVVPKPKATYTDGTSCWVWGNCFITPTWSYAATSSLRGPDFWKDTAKFLKSSVVSPLDSFVFDQTPVSSQWANISSVAASYDLPLFTGSVPVDTEFAKYQDALKAGGVDAIEQQIQTQLDAYLSKHPAKKKALLADTYDKLMAHPVAVPGHGG